MIIETIHEMKKILESKKGKTIGLVPTMGYLHDGHLSLIKRAKKENDIVIMSVFVNPTQFGPNEDYETYPRSIKRDYDLAKVAGAEIVFHPSVEQMYPKGYQTYVQVNEITKNLCGASRPTHFQGVTTVVNKLLNIIQPNRAYFGQKDAQQVAVIKRMVKDLNMNVCIIPCPIVREEDGLAMSSRNTYLSKEERDAALILSKSLKEARAMIDNGERSVLKIKDEMTKKIKTEPLACIDYIEIVAFDEWMNIEEMSGNVLIALAVRFGKTRLIDNILIHVNERSH